MMKKKVEKRTKGEREKRRNHSFWEIDEDTFINKRPDFPTNKIRLFFIIINNNNNQTESRAQISVIATLPWCYFFQRSPKLILLIPMDKGNQKNCLLVNTLLL